ncbi:MAG: UDP-N-acetylglucosamine 2-epimerase (non-hydrolyzing) [Candidatus Eremiobacteraeota bacterium]|nr:UDP-N-acetylglucosamine 2-epimerase (non-hydrolyzing) [Candidatus Eremiobacteraeota bacterium]
MTVFGTRPDTIKMAPVVHALRSAQPAIVPVVCVSAQHRKMLDDLLALFRITPDYDLNIMTPRQTLTQITTRVLEGMEPVLREVSPELVLVHGDTTTSTAAALAAFYQQIPVGHVEAGLRTATRWEPYPEEMNRRLTTAITSWHFAPTARARLHLERENVAPEDIFVTGNTVIDAFLATAQDERVVDAPELQPIDRRRPLIFVTAHRRENHMRMRSICEALKQIVVLPERPQLLWPLHPSPEVAPVAHEILDGMADVHLVSPMTYDATVRAISQCSFVLTDSGGLQEEAPCLGKPVLVMRDQTERPEGIEAGTLQLVGADRARIVAAAATLLSDGAAYARMARAHNPYGDGQAAVRIVAWLLARLRGGPLPEEFRPEAAAAYPAA